MIYLYLTLLHSLAMSRRQTKQYLKYMLLLYIMPELFYCHRKVLAVKVIMNSVREPIQLSEIPLNRLDYLRDFSYFSFTSSN